MVKILKSLILGLSFSIMSTMLSFAATDKEITIFNENYKWNQDDKGWSVTYKKTNKKIRGWLEYDDNKYYFNKDGYMITGWIILDGDWYYFEDDNGDLATDKWIDDYYVNQDGKMVKMK